MFARDWSSEEMMTTKENEEVAGGQGKGRSNCCISQLNRTLITWLYSFGKTHRTINTKSLTACAVHLKLKNK